ncbi:MAG: gliding motility-associated C-terminal domain-containing protein [Saprospiraceae bacterium]|nr:gliding motility-associated C-terminal domain-containing protein [Saprospiraceae bacterium]
MNIKSIRHTLAILQLSVLTFLTIGSSAQPTVQWDKTYGGTGWETLQSAFRTEDGGFLLVGESGSPADGRDVTQPSRGYEDYWLVRIDSMGNKLWDKRYGGDTTDRCFKAIQNTEGYLLIGASYSSKSGDKSENNRGVCDFWLVQIAPDGTKRWEKTYGGSGNDTPFNAITTDNGNSYIIIGHSDSPPSGDKTAPHQGETDIWLLKVDRNGNKIWDKSFGGSLRDEYPYALTSTQDGNFILVGESMSNASGDKSEDSRGQKDYWVIKFNGNGQKIWDKTFGSSSLEEIRDIQELKDGSFLIGGHSSGEPDFDKTAPNYGAADFWIVKIDKNGRKLWDKTYGGDNNDRVIAIEQNKTGYIMLAGQSISLPSGNKRDSLIGDYDFWLIYIDEKGDIIWDQVYGGYKQDVPFEMVRFQDGAYLLCGISNSDAGGNKSENARGKITFPDGSLNTNDMWVVKIKCIFELNLGDSVLVCKTNPVTLDATIPNCRNCLYSWSTGESTPFITLHPTQTQKVFVNVTATNACTIRDDVVLKVIPSPEIAEYSVKPPLCRDGRDAVIALDSARGGTPPYFLVNGKDTFPRRIYIENLAAGNYTISLVDRMGCKLDKTLEIPNPPPFIISLPESKEVQFGDSFRLTLTSNKPLSHFYWSDRSIRSLDTFVKPFDSQTYSVTAIDSVGCVKTAATQVVIRRDNLYFMPLAFSPNGDLINDYFTIYGGKTVVSIDNFQIFQRSGHLIFEKKRIFPAAETEGWDGTFKGQDAPPDVYVFWAEVTYIDGRKELIKGDVTLIR